jgi:hypothetical protein
VEPALQLAGKENQMAAAEFPELPYSAWEETKTKLHLISQIVGKVRLELSPDTNHWWHAPLYVSARGLTTGMIPLDDGAFEVEFDLADHVVHTRGSAGVTTTVPLVRISVAEFYSQFFEGLADIGSTAKIVAKPFDPDRVGSDTPFEKDTTHTAYNADYANRFWRVLVGIEPIFREFRGRFLGKCSPVHFFWHSFDLAVTRFSGRTAPVADDADPVTRQAYSHEVISAGFWPGDGSFREPAFYAYVHPEPAGLEKETLRPDGAWWQPQNGTHMALLRYDDFRTASDPRAALLDFLQSSYEAGAKLAQWPRDELER